MAASEIIYNKADNLEERRQRVAKIIGGLVAYNINHPDPKLRWNNTCAVRMSYILNQSGFRIPFIPKQTVSGGDKKFKYFYRVNHLINFLYAILTNQSQHIPQIGLTFGVCYENF
ncbi:T6SS effector amidase Tae4 family protein [Snodgrassella alvi]|uniref:T6SS effector amidase Tae4 family protein n=1 Tax=Snodgrassella alvi TaxID=1196083 RepID=UPI001C55758B|nr:T6SS effector amidase Tae4 family protein [Snodgrassella alvi]